jgi:hypothetical protein
MSSIRRARSPASWIGQRQSVVELAEPWRDIKQPRPAEIFTVPGKRQLVFVNVAECDDAGQQHGLRAEHIEKDFPYHALRAPGREIERCLRQSFRMRAGLETIDQPALDQRGDDGAQERR